MLDEDKTALARLLHELQAPIVAIRSAAQFMREHPDDHDFLGDIEGFSESMMGLIANAQYAYFGLGNHNRDLRECQLRSDVVARALRSLEPALLKRGFSRTRIEVHGFNDVPPVVTDLRMLTNVLVNLLSNCVRYSAPDPESFRLQILGQLAGPAVHIIVRDWGIGIEEDFSSQLFRRGTRSRTALRVNPTGQGIGLFVAAELVNELQGTIELTNLKHPTEFTLKLPLSLPRDTRRP